MNVTCVPIYGLIFRILTRFHTLYFGASCIHRNSDLLFDVALFRRAFHIDRKSGREGFRGTRIYWKRLFPVHMIRQFLVT